MWKEITFSLKKLVSAIKITLKSFQKSNLWADSWDVAAVTITIFKGSIKFDNSILILSQAANSKKLDEMRPSGLDNNVFM